MDWSVDATIGSALLIITSRILMSMKKEQFSNLYELDIIFKILFYTGIIILVTTIILKLIGL